jgi:hypothetical protein
LKVYCLRAARPDSGPWSLPGRDYLTAIVVVAADELRARQLAASQHGEETAEAWLLGDWIRIEVISETATVGEGIVLTDI